jgi:hypothetical protein
MDKAALRKAMFERIEERIDAEPQDGINAGGDYSDAVWNEQRMFIEGMRSARVSMLAVLDKADTQSR